MPGKLYHKYSVKVAGIYDCLTFNYKFTTKNNIVKHKNHYCVDVTGFPYKDDMKNQKWPLKCAIWKKLTNRNLLNTYFY